MAKYTGNYTAEATKVIKNSDRLCCRVYPDGSIIVVNGYVLFKMNPLEYAAIVQPVTRCDPGNWEIDSTGRHETDKDFLDMWTKTAKAAAAAAPLEFCNLVLSEKKRDILPAYDTEKSTVYLYNRQYIRSFEGWTKFRAADALSPAVAFDENEPFAMVLPINPKTDEGKRIIKATKAWYTDEPASDQHTRHNAELLETAEKLEAERNAAEQEAATARAETEALRAQLAELAEKLESAQAAAQAHDEAVKEEPRETAQDIAARFAKLPGVVATVKGAQTATPIIWLTGDVQRHSSALRQAGALWSGKKSAYYYRCA